MCRKFYFCSRNMGSQRGSEVLQYEFWMGRGYFNSFLCFSTKIRLWFRLICFICYGLSKLNARITFWACALLRISSVSFVFTSKIYVSTPTLLSWNLSAIYQESTGQVAMSSVYRPLVSNSMRPLDGPTRQHRNCEGCTAEPSLSCEPTRKQLQRTESL